MSETTNINQTEGREMDEIIKELCKLNGMLEGEIRCAPMNDEDETEACHALIRASKHIKDAIVEIESYTS